MQKCHLCKSKNLCNGHVVQKCRSTFLTPTHNNYPNIEIYITLFRTTLLYIYAYIRVLIKIWPSSFQLRNFFCKLRISIFSKSYIYIKFNLLVFSSNLKNFSWSCFSIYWKKLCIYIEIQQKAEIRETSQWKFFHIS